MFIAVTAPDRFRRSVTCLPLLGSIQAVAWKAVVGALIFLVFSYSGEIYIWGHPGGFAQREDHFGACFLKWTFFK